MGQIPTGDVKLVPNWTRNYLNILKQYNASRVHNSNIP
jgi:hypothetical protein